MEIDDKMQAALAELKTQLEKISGKEIDASPEQLKFQLAYPIGSASYEENSGVTWKRITLPLVPKFCTGPLTLLDASGRGYTGSDGKQVLLLGDFICDNLIGYLEPVFLLATPKTANACYVTLTHELITKGPDKTIFDDVQITAFTWKPDGTAAPNIAFDWRCRVVSVPPL